jgi:phage terminase small subunit
MNLEKPMPLTAANKILTATRERKDKRIRARYHVDSLPEWLQVPTYLDETACKEWVRVAPQLYAKHPLQSIEDRDRLFFYCRAHSNWRLYSRQLRNWRRNADLTNPQQKQIADDLSKDAEKLLASRKKFAWQLGSVFEVPTGLNLKKISSPRR